MSCVLAFALHLVGCSGGVGAADTGSSGGTSSGGSSSGGSGGSGTGGSGGTSTPPPTLEGVAVDAIAANGTIGLDWPRVEGALGYNVYWSTTPGVTPDTGTGIENAERGFIHRQVDNGTTYYYVVTVLSDAGESAPTAEASATPGGEWVLEHLGTGDFDDILTGEAVPTVPVEQRFQILLFGEGYVDADLPRFHDHEDHFGDRDNDVDRWVDEVFDIEPYSFFPEAFLIWYLPRASNTDIRAESPATAFQVPVEVGGGFPAMGSVQRDGPTAALVWEAIAEHPFPPSDFSGGGFGSVRNFVASFLIYDPERGRASVSGRATSLENPADDSQRVSAAFGVGHAHEFTHAFSSLRDEYMENDNDAPNSWSDTSNVVGSNQCSELPWAHLLAGGAINPDVDGLVGAFGHPDRGFHSELLCQMNGTHENGEYFGDDGGGDCRPDDCTLRSEGRFCNFCREITAFSVFQRGGVLDNETGFDTWVADYRNAFYDRFEFQVPGIHFDGLLPQSNDRNNPEDGTQIFRACVP